MMQRQEPLGLLFAALCALNGAFVPAVARLTSTSADPFFVATVTSVFAGICAVIVLGARGDLHLLVQGAIWPRLLAVGALGTTVAFWLFFLGASRTSAIETVLCLQTEPAYSLLLAWLFLGHRPTKRRLLAILLLLAGIALAVGGRDFSLRSPSSGVWVLLVTPLCWQLSHLVMLRGLVGIAPSVLTGARYTYGGALLAVLWLTAPGTAGMPPWSGMVRLLPWLALQGVVLSYAGTLLWYNAVTRLDLARTTAIVVPSIPLLSLGASFALLGEIPTVPQAIGLGLTIFGVLAFITAPHVVGAWGAGADRDHADSSARR